MSNGPIKTKEKAGLAPESAGPSHTMPASSAPEAGQQSASLQSVQGAAGNMAIQRAVTEGGSSSRMPIPGPATRAALSGSTGVPLPPSLSAAMGSALGSNLDAVRVHTGQQAASAAKELHANAFTRGQDIFFGAGRYQPDTTEGQKLLAHELTHTIQQGASGPLIVDKLETSQPGEATEQEAEAAAKAIVQGKSFNPTQDQTMQIARQPLDAGVATPAPDAGTLPTAPTVSPPTQGPSPAPATSSLTGAPQSAPTVSPPTAVPSPAPAVGTPGSTTEIIFPPFTVFEGEEKTIGLLDLPLLSYPLWEEPIELPPPLFLATVGLYAKIGFKLELFLRYGPAVIRDIRLALDPLSNRYSGTGQFYMPVTIGPRAKLQGSLTGSLDWLGLVEVLAIEGGLSAVGQAPLILAIGPSVNLIYDSGTFSFNLRPQIEAGIALVFDLNAFAQARFDRKVVWEKIWNLYHWQWGRAVRFGTLISLDYIHGHLQPIRTQEFGERISIDELLQGLKEPAKGGGIQVIQPGKPPLQERLRQLLDTSGGDPHVILAALAEGSDSEKAAILADASMLQSLQKAISNELWPTAQRILNNAPSETVPSLDEGTVFIANRHIAVGRFSDALQVVVSYLQAHGIVDTRLCNFVYTRETTQGEGLTNTSYTTDPHGMLVPSGPSQVQIYDPAFVNVPWLYSTIMHEYVHVLQDQITLPPASPAADDADRAEVEAYLWEIEHARGSGVIVSPAQMQELGQRLTDHFNALHPHTQTIYRKRYNDVMALVRDATSGVAPVNLTYSIADARRKIQESSRQIAKLVEKRQNAGDRQKEEEFDRLIATIQRESAEALVEVVLAENPSVQIVDRKRGIYRVPVVDGSGRVQWVYGSITVVWQLQQLSPSVFTIGATIRSNPAGAALPPGTHVDSRLLVGGSAIQSRVQLFPGDIDFAEEFDVMAPEAASAGAAIAETIVEFVRRNIGNPELEFVKLQIMPKGRKLKPWSQESILDPKQRTELRRQLASIDEGRINTFWKALIEGERPGEKRFIEITKVLSVHAISSVTGKDIFKTVPAGAQFQEAYLDKEPQQIEPSMLGWYASLMRELAIKEADAGHYLKAAKRAFNYMRTIGNLEGIAAVTPIFATGEARVNQQLAVLEAITWALNQKTPSRILTVDIARNRLNETATLIKPTMPNKAAKLQQIAAAIRGVEGRVSDPVAPDPYQSGELAEVTEDIKHNIDSSLQVQVTDIINRYVR